jgi:hypothetical protein
MKLINIARIAIVLTFISCGNDDSVVTIPKQEYQKLIGDTIQPTYPKPFKLYDGDISDFGHGIVLGSDGHEYLVTNTGQHSKNVEHYIDCVKCIERSQDSVKNK